MSRRPGIKSVPLEAGAGPDNPPCPACGEPLFGWIDERPGLSGPVSRCESCGLGVVGDPGAPAEALAALDRQERRFPNRAGFAAWFGGAGWAGLEPGSRYFFTEEAVRRLVANRDQVVRRFNWVPSASLLAMWQTILNGFTFGRNVALGAFGRATAVPAEKTWQRRLDGLISVLVAVPAMIVALPLELITSTFGRPSVLAYETELL